MVGLKKENFRYDLLAFEAVSKVQKYDKTLDDLFENFEFEGSYRGACANIVNESEKLCSIFPDEKTTFEKIFPKKEGKIKSMDFTKNFIEVVTNKNVFEIYKTNQDYFDSKKK
ncbi:MAG: hypothetical protein U9Q99_01995 [Nanoarchaeota archaeon]|nr:hypothetical protein [Nanoarchaeota archaeon]